MYYDTNTASDYSKIEHLIPSKQYIFTISTNVKLQDICVKNIAKYDIKLFIFQEKV